MRRLLLAGAGRHPRRLAVGFFVLLFVVSFAGTASAGFTRFAHPKAEGTIKAGEDVRVTAVSPGGTLPTDLVLEYSEDEGATFNSLSDVRLTRGSVTGVYEPTAAQGNRVVLRTRSASEPSYGQSIQVFVQP